MYINQLPSVLVHVTHRLQTDNDHRSGIEADVTRQYADIDTMSLSHTFLHYWWCLPGRPGMSRLSIKLDLIRGYRVVARKETKDKEEDQSSAPCWQGDSRRSYNFKLSECKKNAPLGTGVGGINIPLVHVVHTCRSWDWGEQVTGIQVYVVDEASSFWGRIRKTSIW